MIKRPAPGEYSEFAGRYVNLVGDAPILDILEALKESTYSFFISLSADQADYAYEAGKWNTKEVLGHMIDAERIFAYRILCFTREEVELPGFDQDVYFAKATFNSRTLTDLANEFKACREANMYLFRSITESQSLQKGVASGNPVSVRALLYIMAGHELHHMDIFKERYFKEW